MWPPPIQVPLLSRVCAQIQHLIERCLLLYMDRDDCVKALAKYAHVKPAITLTVWKELEKENKDFFTAYTRHRADSEARAFSKALDDATARLCQHKLEECTEMLKEPSKQLQPRATQVNV
eukprot:TRINITY_DN1344_c0_g1_i2.p1 TRINITY_DN1344_c0_g1~~TRINITY_DN1344_c0_g1_i2.p1  ORF type:complete len:120 (+),score=9.75 TRINITY_DN1344_c0_g1_i2:399-758(+)